jgi:phenylacetate-coenzyme A ligase PaaK-like adenylate-forming protein
VVSRPETRDEMTLRVQLAEEVDREKLSDALRKSIKDICRVKVDRIEFVAEIPEDAKRIVDERVWE